MPGEDINDEKAAKIWKGSQKPIRGDKECLLLFDKTTGELRLEKLASNISVKATR